MASSNATTYQVWGARKRWRGGENGSGIEGDTPRARIQGVVSLVPAGEKFLKIFAGMAKLVWREPRA